MWTFLPGAQRAPAVVAALILAASLVPLLAPGAAATTGTSCGGFAPLEQDCTTSFATTHEPQGLEARGLLASHCVPLCVSGEGIVAVEVVDTTGLSTFECILAAGVSAGCTLTGGDGLQAGVFTLTAQIALPQGLPAAGDWEVEIVL